MEKTYVSFRLKETKIKISLLFVIPWGFFFLFGMLREFSIAFASIAVHELAHMFCALGYGRKIVMVRVLPIGINASVEDIYSASEGIAIYLAGPLSSIVLWFILPVLNLNEDITQIIRHINLMLGVFNLMPMLPLDGGNVLRYALALRFGHIKAAVIIDRISHICTIVIFSIYIMLLIYGINYIWLVIIILYVYAGRKKRRMEASFLNIKRLLSRKERILRKGIYPIRTVAVIENESMADMVKNLDYDQYHLIYIMNEDLDIVKTVSEKDYLKALTGKRAVTFKDML